MCKTLGIDLWYNDKYVILKSQVCWCILGILALRRLRQGDQWKFEAILVCRVSP